MKKSTKAALISGLVFPGLGHLYLRKFVIGVALVCLASWSVYSIAASAIAVAQEVVNEIQNGSHALDVKALNELVTQRSQQAEQATQVPALVFFFSWVIGIVHSYRVGLAQERLEELLAGRHSISGEKPNRQQTL